MSNRMITMLGNAAKRQMLTGSGVATHDDGTTTAIKNLKLERIVSGLGSTDEQDASDSQALRARLFTPLGSGIQIGDRLTVDGEAYDWFVLDEDSGGTERAITRIAMMRQDSGTTERTVTFYRYSEMGVKTDSGPYRMHVNYDNRVAKETVTNGSSVRRVDGVLSINQEIDVSPGDLFTIDMEGGNSFSGLVYDVNTSTPGRTEVVITVQRGVARVRGRER